MYKAIVNVDTYISILEDRHANELFHLIDTSRESIRQWLQFPDLTHNVEDTRAFISRSLKRFANNDGYWAGIWYKEQIAGSIGFLRMDWDAGRTEIGYWLGSQFEGKGLMTAACRTFVEHAFHELQLRKIEIGAAVNNMKSRAIPERLGFTQEGIIRNYECLHNQYVDRVIYGLTQKEWQDRHALH
ncbi:GNAT family N-acetyltransferase [Paenibacillus sp. XY044]|uniref:GNAT family N-acetyltransferase n=1 Tax=Paenibacillus sp. XY044 TaxID=2026089 RepID=UPI000B983C86|nr:GNAT family protein [Paenibacillus sp. XY044]OZB98716.1 ribosomal-protein-serine acetyltransferase [Paenibacillus sp. XY044]